MVVSYYDLDGFSYDVGVHFVINCFVVVFGVFGLFYILFCYGEVVYLVVDWYLVYFMGLFGVFCFVVSVVWEWMT